MPAEDSEALARMIDRAWKDKELRERTAALGYRHALALGGELELVQRLVSLTAAWYLRRTPEACAAATRTR